MDVRNVHFDKRLLDELQRVQDRDRAERKAGGIDDYRSLPFERFLQPVDHLSFMIRLPEDALQSELLCEAAALRLDLGQRCRAVEMRLTLTEHVQIGAIEDVDRRHGNLSVICVWRSG